MYKVKKAFNRIYKGKHLRHFIGDTIEMSTASAKDCVKRGLVSRIKQTKQLKETTEEEIETK